MRGLRPYAYFYFRARTVGLRSPSLGAGSLGMILVLLSEGGFEICLSKVAGVEQWGCQE